MGVRGFLSLIGRVLPKAVAADGGGEVVPESRHFMNATTSSFKTRPSLPVPEISDISIPNSLAECLTAGVASDACLGGCRVVFSGATSGPFFVVIASGSAAPSCDVSLISPCMSMSTRG